jgi:hypothetical protein
MENTGSSMTPIARLSRDIAQAAKTLTDDEARFLVDAYYIVQEDRKRSSNQVRALGETAEPNSVLQWFTEQNETLEAQLKRALDRYTEGHTMGAWMRAIHGIGPVLSAGLLAHIDIHQAPTVGHIWRYAGLDPTMVWGKGERRPWNAQLKCLTWKIGQSFMKFSNHPACYYGHLYRERKAFEMQRSEGGLMAEYAATRVDKVGKTTEAYKAYTAGKLPPGQIDGRARRYAVKRFLADLQTAWWWQAYGVLPPKPYVISILGHAHHELSPSHATIPELHAALAASGAQQVWFPPADDDQQEAA